MTIPLIRSRDGKTEERISWGDYYSSFVQNDQLNSTYEVSLTLTYQQGFERVFNMAKPKAFVIYDGQTYVIQQPERSINEQGFLTEQITANNALIDKLKNLRVDANPESNTTDNGQSSSTSADNTNQPSTVTKPTDVQQTFSLQSCLDQFFNNNDQGVTYQLHGTFPQAAVTVSGSCLDWITANEKSFNYCWYPDGNVLHITSYEMLKHQTGETFRYMSNMTTAQITIDVNDIVNDVKVYAGKMETTTTTGGGDAGTPVSKDAQGVIDDAKKYLGVPYVYGGAGGSRGGNPFTGMDCSSFVSQVYKDFGINIPAQTAEMEPYFHDVSTAQTGDVGFYGAHGSSYHVVLFLDANTMIYEPQEGEVCKIEPVSYYPPSWIGRNDQMAAIVNGGTSAGGDTTTTTADWYKIKYEYKDQDSINLYGLHRGAPVTVDSIYDQNLLNDYLAASVQSKPPTTLTISYYGTKHFKIGDQIRLIAPELNLNTDVMLVGISQNEVNNEAATLTFNNTGLAMKDVYMAIYQDIHNTNQQVNQLSSLRVIGGTEEDHFGRLTVLDKDDVNKIKNWTEGVAASANS